MGALAGKKTPEDGPKDRIGRVVTEIENEASTERLNESTTEFREQNNQLQHLEGHLTEGVVFIMPDCRGQACYTGGKHCRLIQECPLTYLSILSQIKISPLLPSDHDHGLSLKSRIRQVSDR